MDWWAIVLIVVASLIAGAVLCGCIGVCLQDSEENTVQVSSTNDQQAVRQVRQILQQTQNDQHAQNVKHSKELSRLKALQKARDLEHSRELERLRDEQRSKELEHARALQNLQQDVRTQADKSERQHSREIRELSSRHSEELREMREEFRSRPSGDCYYVDNNMYNYYNVQSTRDGNNHNPIGSGYFLPQYSDNSSQQQQNNLQYY